MVKSFPDTFRSKLDANVESLRGVARTFGGQVQAIDRALAATWLEPAKFNEIHLLETENDGRRVTVLTNLVQWHSHSGHKAGDKGTTTWHAHHVIAIRLHDSPVKSALDTVTSEMPIVGTVRLPHFTFADASVRRAPNEWVPASPLPSLARPWRLGACIDGVLYAKSELDELDEGSVKEAIHAMSSVAAQPFRAPSAEEIAARTAANKRRGKITCLALLVGLVAFIAAGVWLWARLRP